MERERRRAAAVAALMVALLSACGGDDDNGLDAIDTPSFQVDGGGDDVTTSTVGSDDSITTPAPAAGGTTTVPAASGDSGVDDAGGGPATIESVSFEDPVGDATPGVGTGTPPPWTDLAGGSLERQGNAYRLTVRLGGAAPASAAGDQTMNIATFFDVDDDGSVDRELWINLGPDGWGPFWYDDRGNAAPGESSNVTVVADGDEVRLLFPDVMLDQPDRLRFSMSSEYGELSAIGSSFARRDDAPDDDRSVPFPS